MNYVVRRPPQHPWEQWFAWRPVTVDGQRVWLDWVWRKWVPWGGPVPLAIPDGFWIYTQDTPRYQTGSN